MPEWREKHLPVEGTAGAVLAKLPASAARGAKTIATAAR